MRSSPRRSRGWSPRQVYRWSDLDFEANRRDGNGVDWPIRYRDLEPWYGHVERFIGVSGQAEGLPQLPDSVFQPPMQMNTVEKAVKQRIGAAYPDRRMIIGRCANVTEPLGDRAACHYCGVCQRGCSSGACFSSLSSTLPAATSTGLLTLRANSVVEGVDYDPVRKRASGVRVIDTVTGERTRFASKLVFLCASFVPGILRSPFEIDIYVWLTWRFFRLRKPVTIPWGSLALQFGSGYANPRHFKKRFLGYLRSVIGFYPTAALEARESGLVLKPSPPHVASRSPPMKL